MLVLNKSLVIFINVFNDIYFYYTIAIDLFRVVNKKF